MKFDFVKFEQENLLDRKILAEEAVDFAACLSKLNSDELLLYEERAAIMEFDGGLSRNEAELRALESVIIKKQADK